MRSPQGYSVTVRPKDKTPADEYRHQGKTFIEGRHNSYYVIDLRNETNVGVEAVVSVDGLAVTDGEPAHFKSRGFVVPAFQTVTLKGWLLNEDSAAQFVFGDKRDSYAQKSSSQTQTGVIGVAWFPELMVVNAAHTVAQPLVWSPTAADNRLRRIQHTSSATGPLIGSNSVYQAHADATVGSMMSTQFGPAVSNPTHTTSFLRRSPEPEHVSMIYYDSAQNLTKMGIKLKSRLPAYHEAFPANSPTYCEPPPGWVNKKW